MKTIQTKQIKYFQPKLSALVIGNKVIQKKDIAKQELSTKTT